MFDNNIKTEPIPERVYELCKMVSKGDIDDNVARERMEPKGINPSGSTSYYPSIREVCVQELKLIEKDNDTLKFIGDKQIVLKRLKDVLNVDSINSTQSDFLLQLDLYIKDMTTISRIYIHMVHGVDKKISK